MEKYVIKPSLQFYVTYTITGDQHEELTDTFVKDEQGNSVKVVQTIDGLTLKTKRILTYKLGYMGNAFSTKETATEITKLRVGIKLVYVENKGYVLPERNICKIDEAIDDLKVLKTSIE